MHSDKKVVTYNTVKNKKKNCHAILFLRLVIQLNLSSYGNVFFLRRNIHEEMNVHLFKFKFLASRSCASHKHIKNFNRGVFFNCSEYINNGGMQLYYYIFMILTYSCNDLLQTPLNSYKKNIRIFYFTWNNNTFHIPPPSTRSRWPSRKQFPKLHLCSFVWIPRWLFSSAKTKKGTSPIYLWR